MALFLDFEKVDGRHDNYYRAVWKLKHYLAYISGELKNLIH